MSLSVVVISKRSILVQYPSSKSGTTPTSGFETKLKTPGWLALRQDPAHIMDVLYTHIYVDDHWIDDKEKQMSHRLQR